MKLPLAFMLVVALLLAAAPARQETNSVGITLVAIQPGHTLVTGGVYSLIRHPSYLGLLVNSLGWSLAFRSGVGVLLTLLIVLPVLARIRAEEALLRSQFGGEYDEYRGRTARLIPGLW